MRETSTKPLAYVLSLVSDRTGARKDSSKPYVGLEHIPSSGLSLTALGSAQDSVSTNNVFVPGDVLFGKLRPRLRKSVRVNVAGYCSTDVLVLRPTEKVDPAFAGFVAQSDAVFSTAIRTEEGTKMPRCSWRDLRAVEVFCPNDKNVQKRTAAILTSLDTAIEKTEALIEKHQQIKAGLMHDLFTRGVLLNGQLRPLCEEAPEMYRQIAAGWIPCDWNLQLLNQTINPARPIVYGILMPGYGFPGGVPVVKVKDIRGRSIAVDGLLLTSPLIDHEFRRSRLKEGDILFTIRGSVGRVAIVPPQLGGANITQDTARIDLVGVSNRFASFYFETAPARRFFEVNTLGVAVQGINLGELRKLPVPIPPIAEQERIADRLTSVLGRIETEMAISEKLCAQKLGLMQDLLTGKVPVKVADLEVVLV